jgi:hypothetical protein
MGLFEIRRALGEANAAVRVRDAYKAAVKHMAKAHDMPKDMFPFEGYGTESLKSVWSFHEAFPDCRTKFPKSIYDL